jgi:hypothetical protein
VRVGTHRDGNFQSRIGEHFLLDERKMHLREISPLLMIGVSFAKILAVRSSIGPGTVTFPSGNWTSLNERYAKGIGICAISAKRWRLRER